MKVFRNFNPLASRMYGLTSFDITYKIKLFEKYLKSSTGKTTLCQTFLKNILKVYESDHLSATYVNLMINDSGVV